MADTAEVSFLRQFELLSDHCNEALGFRPYPLTSNFTKPASGMYMTAKVVGVEYTSTSSEDINVGHPDGLLQSVAYAYLTFQVEVVRGRAIETLTSFLMSLKEPYFNHKLGEENMVYIDNTAPVDTSATLSKQIIEDRVVCRVRFLCQILAARGVPPLTIETVGPLQGEY